MGWFSKKDNQVAITGREVGINVGLSLACIERRIARLTHALGDVTKKKSPGRIAELEKSLRKYQLLKELNEG